ncbi:hypothetical protein M0R45_021022 [Rubus argutus]|uniref:Uncharacterized protein n=1 Tax=Rubus argutus TaxID=59490 RepID=A0AAW1XA44_RUBAR
MAFEQRFARIEESKVFYSSCMAPPVCIRAPYIIENCHGMQFHSNSPMAPQKVIVNLQVFLLEVTIPKCSAWENQVPNLTKRPVIHGNVEVPQTVSKPINSDEAANSTGVLW